VGSAPSVSAMFLRVTVPRLALLASSVGVCPPASSSVLSGIRRKIPKSNEKAIQDLRRDRVLYHVLDQDQCQSDSGGDTFMGGDPEFTFRKFSGFFFYHK
jgi:hypothetical protein